MLQKMGVPESLRTIILALHTDFMVKIKSGLEDVETSYTTGVKQCDSLTPILFVLYFQMCIEVLDSRWIASKPSFLYKMDGIMNRRKANERGGTQMEFFKSMHADDGAFVNTSRWDVDHSIPLIFSTLKEFSLTMHVEREDKRGKTEAVFFPCAADVRHTLKNSHSCIHTQTHIRTHTHPITRTPPLTHTHLTNLPHTSHQHPPLFCCERRQRNTSLAAVSQQYFQARVRNVSNDEGRS